MYMNMSIDMYIYMEMYNTVHTCMYMNIIYNVHVHVNLVFKCDPFHSLRMLVFEPPLPHLSLLLLLLATSPLLGALGERGREGGRERRKGKGGLT